MEPTHSEHDATPVEDASTTPPNDAPAMLSTDAPASAPDPDALRAALVSHLQSQDVLRDEDVTRAVSCVPRHIFLPAVSLRDAYADAAIPTHWEHNVAVSSASQPAIVALMLEQLRVEPGMRVLEIGAGTGYNAALLSELVGPSGQVVTLDIDPEIVAEASAHLATAGYPAVQAYATDGAAGWPEGAPYDRVILTVGASDIAPAWVEQLREDGVLVLPLALGGFQASIAFRKRGGLLISEALTYCGFMRLRGMEAAQGQQATLPRGRVLLGDRAAELAEPVARLLETRPRPLFWHRPSEALVQYLGLHGHALLTLLPPPVKNLRRSRRRPLGRLGIYAEDADGPSLALFANALPVLLTFGSAAARQIVEQAAADWHDRPLPPLERWQIIARPRADAEQTPVAEGAVRLLRRHFAFDVTL